MTVAARADQVGHGVGRMVGACPAVDAVARDVLDVVDLGRCAAAPSVSELALVAVAGEDTAPDVRRCSTATTWPPGRWLRLTLLTLIASVAYGAVGSEVVG